MIPIDRHVRLLVDAMNASGMFGTLASCHGHRWEGKSPYVMFAARRGDEDVIALERALRAAWADEITQYEWGVRGGAGETGMPVWFLALPQLVVDLPWPSLSWCAVRRDLRALAEVVHELAKAPRIHAETDDDIAHTGAAAHQAIADGPRIWLMPTPWARLRRFGNQVAAVCAGNQRHGWIPYDFLNFVRGHDMHAVAAAFGDGFHCDWRSPGLRLVNPKPWRMRTNSPATVLARSLHAARESEIAGAMEGAILLDRNSRPTLVEWRCCA